MSSRKSKLIITAVFLIIIFGIALGNIIYPDRVFSEKENRYLAAMPEFTWEAVYSGSFSEKFEKYTTDQFIYRDAWTQAKAMCEIARLKRDNNGVYFGSGGYLLGKYDNSDIDMARLQKNETQLKAFVDKYAELLGKFRVSVMIVPMSSSVLKERLPYSAYGFDQNEMIDSIRDKSKSGNFVDVRGVLEGNSDGYIYYRTDHHWTTLGAYLAYEKWCSSIGIEPAHISSFDFKEVSNEFYGTYYSKANLYTIKPDTITILVPKEQASYRVTYNGGERVEDTLYNMSYLNKRDKYSLFLSGNNPLVKVETQVNNGRNLLIIKDSFAHTFAPIAANSFETVHMIDFRYYNMSIYEYIKENDITDLLILYSTINFATDTNLHKLRVSGRE